MNKLLKLFFSILFLLILDNSGFCQRRMYMGPPRGRMPVQHVVPVYRMPQPPNPGRKIISVKESFINRRLNLTPEQSRVFWPVYHRYQQDLMTVRYQKRLNNSSASSNGTEQIDKEIAYEQQLVAIHKQYKDEFLKILPPEKVSQLYKSEREFNDEVLKQLSERNLKPGE
jgi:hypothetical protein